MFDIDQRFFIAKQSLNYAEIDVPVFVWEGDIANYIENYTSGANVIIRGIRNATDLEYEIMLEQYYKDALGMEVVYLTPATENLHTSSTLIRNFIKTKKFEPILKYVSPSIYKYIVENTK